MSDLAQATPRGGENLRGIALLTLGMALIAALDSVAKFASDFTDPTWVVTGVGLGAAVGFVGAILRSGQALVTPAILNPVVLLRSLSDAGGSFLIILSLSLVPLSLVTVIMQTVPLMITLGAVIVLRERAGLPDWLALIAGFLGTLIIIRPGVEGFDAPVLIAVAAAAGFAIRDLASRAAPRSVSTFQLGAWGGMSLAVTGVALSLVQGNPPPPATPGTLGVFAAMVALATSALYCVTAAMRIGDVAVVAPFRYTRLVFGIALGIALFGETLDGPTLLGGAIIVASGLFVWWRERRKAKG